METQNIQNNTNNKVQKLDFNRVVIFQVTKLINDGKPIFGMLMLNEYLKKDSPIRLSIANIAREEILEASDYILPQSFLKKILDEGYTFSMLSLKEQEIFAELNEKSYSKIESEEVVTRSSITELSKKRAQEGLEKLSNIYIKNRKNNGRIRFEGNQTERKERAMLHIVNI